MCWSMKLITGQTVCRKTNVLPFHQTGYPLNHKVHPIIALENIFVAASTDVAIFVVCLNKQLL